MLTLIAVALLVTITVATILSVIAECLSERGARAIKYGPREMYGCIEADSDLTADLRSPAGSRGGAEGVVPGVLPVAAVQPHRLLGEHLDALPAHDLPDAA